MGDRSDILQGTLDLMVLQTLEAMGPLHGYGIARRIEQISDDVLSLNQGTIYASLLRLQQRRWIAASWGTSEHNRKAMFYSITRAGRRQLAFGGAAQITEQQREDRGLPIVDATLQDLRYAIRSLRRNRAFAAVTILTLAVGIAAATAMFTVANAVLLRPLPYPEPERLVEI